MKKLVCLILAVVAVFSLTGCGDNPQYTLEYWAVNKVLTERYKDIERPKMYKVEPAEATETDDDCYDKQYFMVTVTYLRGDGIQDRAFYLVTVTIKQRCVHSPIDWFRNKKGADALVCKDCIEKITCSYMGG